MTDFTELSIAEREEMQRSLAANRKDNIANWRGYKGQYPDIEGAGSTFVQNIINTEMQMKFNAAAIKQMKLEEQARNADKKGSAPTLPRYRGH